MNLHHAGQRPDWEGIDPRDWNTWQRLAAQTDGFVTPGNALSVVGHAVSIGSVVLGKTPEARGVGFFLGRLFDVVDGKTADVTGTKSQRGAAVDAIGDKIAIVIATIAALARRELAPTQAVTMITENAVKAACNTTVHAIGGEPRPNLAGKLSTACQSVVIGSSIAAKGLQRYPAIARTAEVIGRVAWTGACVLGCAAIAGYVGDIKNALDQRTEYESGL